MKKLKCLFGIHDYDEGKIVQELACDLYRLLTLEKTCLACGKTKSANEVRKK